MKPDRGTIETTLASELPTKSRWMLDNTPLDFEFTVARGGLQALPDDVQKFGDSTWSDLLVFGEYDYAEGGGARALLCVRESDGSVCGLDLERDVAIFPLNSSADKFAATFQLLDNYLAHDRPLPTDCESRVRSIDASLEPSSDWLLLITP
jgi:hypothetical protein